MTQNRTKRRHGSSVCSRHGCGALVKNGSIRLCAEHRKGSAPVDSWAGRIVSELRVDSVRVRDRPRVMFEKGMRGKIVHALSVQRKALIRDGFVQVRNEGY